MRFLSTATMAFLVATVYLVTTATQAQVRITEWMYNGLGDGNTGEFVELTNVGNVNVDFTGWSFDDSSRTAGTISLSALGIVAPGKSVVLTDSTAADFRSNWSLTASIKIVGENAANLGRNDEINIFDGAQALIERLTYGDQDIPGTIRTQNVSGVPTSAASLGANNASLWKLSASGVEGATTSSNGEVGSPGMFSLVPEPSTIALLLATLSLACGRRRRL